MQHELFSFINYTISLPNAEKLMKLDGEYTDNISLADIVNPKVNMIVSFPGTAVS